LANRAAELAKLYDEMLKRYQALADNHPKFAKINLARFGQALALHRKGDLAKSRQILEAIPPAERAGDLALVPYLLADCLIRLAAVKADDPPTIARLEKQLKGAVEQLDLFVGSQPNSPEAPDALLKLGLCHQRLAANAAQPPERLKILANARA